MFDVELSLVGDTTSEEAGRLEAKSTIILRRDYQEFRVLHQSLIAGVASKNKDVLLPPLPLYKSDEYTDADMAEDLAAYIHLLLSIPEVTQSKQFLGLLHDHDGPGGAESAGAVPENAVDFLLQPCSYSPLYVPRRTKHEQEVEVPAGSTVLWRFSVGDRLDIQFSINFVPESLLPGGQDAAATTGEVGKQVTVLPPTRCPSMAAAATSTTGPSTAGESGVLGSTSSSSLDASSLTHSATISISSSAAGEGVFGEVCQGLYTAAADGVCTFTWDNTYSRLRGKQVQFILQVVDEMAMAAAVEAAEEMSRACSRSRSLLTSRIEGGDGATGKIGVKVTPIARPAMDADSFFNKDDLTIEDETRGLEGGAGSHVARKSSMGAIWEYLLQANGKGKGKEEGGEDHSGLQKVMAEVEKLEDDIAAITAKKEQAEAETIIALAKQRRWSIEKERFERKMNEALQKAEQHSETIKGLQTERAQLLSNVAKLSQEAESACEGAKRAEREKDVLLAEKHVWTMAHSGVQAELVKNLSALEKEKQTHEDTRTALRKAKDSIQKMRTEIEDLKGRLEQKVDERALQTAQGELTAARAEIRDLTDAIEEAGAENDHLRGQLRLVAKHVKQQKQDAAALQAELSELRMNYTSQEKKMCQLRAEKKLLVRELKKAGRGSFSSELADVAASVGRARSGSIEAGPSTSSYKTGEAEGLNGRRASFDSPVISGLASPTSAPAPPPSTSASASPPPPTSQKGSVPSPTPPPAPAKKEEEEVASIAMMLGLQSTGDRSSSAKDSADKPPAQPQNPPPTEKEGSKPAEAAEASKSAGLGASAQPPPPQSTKPQSSSPPPQQPVKPQAAQQGAQQAGGIGKKSAAEVELEKDEKYRRLMGQLANSMERRQQLLALLEEDPQNSNVKELLQQLEEVLALLRRRMRALLSAKEQQQAQAAAPPPITQGEEGKSREEGAAGGVS